MGMDVIASFLTSNLVHFLRMKCQMNYDAKFMAFLYLPIFFPYLFLKEYMILFSFLYLEINIIM